MDPSLFSRYLLRSIEAHERWTRSRSPYVPDSSLEVDEDRIAAAFDELMHRLGECYPFFHPSYIGQMLKPPHPAAMLAYFAAMQINPNNHALDGGPATSTMEKEAVADIGRMFGYDAPLGHLTGGGTVANLEALWVAREIHPDKRVVFSDQAHYTHRRMCDLIGLKYMEIPSDASGRMDIDSLRNALYSEEIGTIVATVGTTGLGAVDPVHSIVAIAEEFGCRVHADAAYGGFYTLLARGEACLLDPVPFRAIPSCDSIVIDPHKHGLQPYGCGCVLFRDPSVGMIYHHDSPYTYFTSNDLHLGEISLECSRAGASAAALWFSLRCFPLERESGLGPILRGCREAAITWADLIRTSTELYIVTEPMLDIVTWFPRPVTMSACGISLVSEKMFEHAMRAPAPKFLSKFRIPTAKLQMRYPEIRPDAEDTTVLRSVLMKPEHRSHISTFHSELEELARVISSECDQ